MSIIVRLSVVFECQYIPFRVFVCFVRIDFSASYVHEAAFLFLAFEDVCVECCVLPAVDGRDGVLLKGIGIYSVFPIWILSEDRYFWCIELHFVISHYSMSTV